MLNRNMSAASSSNSSWTLSMNGSDGQQPQVQPAHWQHRVSAAFSAMAEQINAASQAVSLIPPMNDVVLNDLRAKLDVIEENQQQLRDELAALNARIDNVNAIPERLEKKLDDQIAAFNADQLRMPARLHNATCHKYPQLIKAVPISAGKVPKNFPATKGEFEHVTKERYEAIMNEYGIPFSGDTNAKRETLRSFLGLPAVDEGGKRN